MPTLDTLTPHEIQTLIRLLCTVADGDVYDDALNSFSDPDEVAALVDRAMRLLDFAAPSDTDSPTDTEGRPTHA